LGDFAIGSSSVFAAGRIGRWPPPAKVLLNFLNNFGDKKGGDNPPPLGGDFLGEDYGLFGRAVAIHFLCESKKFSLIFKNCPPPL